MIVRNSAQYHMSTHTISWHMNGITWNNLNLCIRFFKVRKFPEYLWKNEGNDYYRLKCNERSLFLSHSLESFICFEHCSQRMCSWLGFVDRQNVERISSFSNLWDSKNQMLSYIKSISTISLPPTPKPYPTRTEQTAHKKGCSLNIYTHKKQMFNNKS